MTSLRMVPLLAVALVAFGCHTEPTAPGVLAVTHAPNAAFRLHNTGSGPVYYFVVERGLAAVINWARCEGSGCPSVPARDSVDLPYAQISGYSATATEASVFWWRSLADSVRGFNVPF